ncbi:hypothetical protein SEA_MARSHAWN_84 [Mycobacterium phage Marshawn]|uniref:Uncharacterized protein n=1 Tax=Mycobacterium phage Marshawn TaxID=2652423 RepID=A0A5P8D9V4_9CAUD|nr:hypothetical protein I5H02_gp15 [Mycobacterium phage Marshawn]QFP94870.1 hypothetical protein SEA_MARSHAWN_84 [Mycobacterium phage Marshawn]
MAPPMIALQADRQHGLTTALLDVALANARRGQSVTFWSPTASQSHHSFRTAVRLVLDEAIDMQAAVLATNGREAMRFPRGGVVRFVWGYAGRHAEADVRIVDAEGPEGEAAIVRPRAEVRNAGR